MVNNGYIDLKKLSIDELAGVVNLYPWFGAARKELCLRMSQIGGRGWSESDYATNALYLGSRKSVFEIARSGKQVDCSDKDLDKLLSSYTSGQTAEAAPQARKVRAVGGDFFSQDDYDSVRKADDSIFASFASKVRSEESPSAGGNGSILDEFCTETLALIYIEQGYYEQAKYIYSKLILRYPEKNAYFAALIEKLNQFIDN